MKNIVFSKIKVGILIFLGILNLDIANAMVSPALPTGPIPQSLELRVQDFKVPSRSSHLFVNEAIVKNILLCLGFLTVARENSFFDWHPHIVTLNSLRSLSRGIRSKIDTVIGDFSSFETDITFTHDHYVLQEIMTRYGDYFSKCARANLARSNKMVQMLHNEHQSLEHELNYAQGMGLASSVDLALTIERSHEKLASNVLSRDALLEKTQGLAATLWKLMYIFDKSSLFMEFPLPDQIIALFPEKAGERTTLIEMIIRLGNFPALSFLLSRDDIIMDSRFLPLHIGLKFHVDQVLSFLLQEIEHRPYLKDMLLNKKDRQGNTALHSAVKLENCYLVKTLLRIGADPTLRNKRGKLAIEELDSTGSQSERIKAVLQSYMPIQPFCLPCETQTDDPFHAVHSTVNPDISPEATTRDDTMRDVEVDPWSDASLAHAREEMPNPHNSSTRANRGRRIIPVRAAHYAFGEESRESSDEQQRSKKCQGCKCLIQ